MFGFAVARGSKKVAWRKRWRFGVATFASWEGGDCVASDHGRVSYPGPSDVLRKPFVFNNIPCTLLCTYSVLAYNLCIASLRRVNRTAHDRRAFYLPDKTTVDNFS